MEANDSIGARLKNERERLGFGQEAFADAMNVTRQTQSKYEKEKRYPDAVYLRRFAELGGDVQYVLTGVRSSSDLESVTHDTAPTEKEIKSVGCAKSEPQTQHGTTVPSYEIKVGTGVGRKGEAGASVQEPRKDTGYGGDAGAVALTPEQEAWVKLFMALPQDQRDRLRALGDALADAAQIKEKAKGA